MLTFPEALKNSHIKSLPTDNVEAHLPFIDETCCRAKECFTGLCGLEEVPADPCNSTA
jgi:hypothetical protein